MSFFLLVVCCVSGLCHGQPIRKTPSNVSPTGRARTMASHTLEELRFASMVALMNAVAQTGLGTEIAPFAASCQSPGDALFRNPITGIVGCCARAAVGQVRPRPTGSACPVYADTVAKVESCIGLSFGETLKARNDRRFE